MAADSGEVNRKKEMQEPRLVYRNSGPKGSKSLTPNKRDVTKIVSSKAQDVFVDQQGRLYGIINPDNDVLKTLKDSGEVDNEFTFMYWVCLISPVKHTPVYLGNSLKRPTRVPRSALMAGEESEFPQVGERIPLKNYYTGEQEDIFQVQMFPEKYKPGSKTTSIVLRLYS